MAKESLSAFINELHALAKQGANVSKLVPYARTMYEMTQTGKTIDAIPLTPDRFGLAFTVLPVLFGPNQEKSLRAVFNDPVYEKFMCTIEGHVSDVKHRTDESDRQEWQATFEHRSGTTFSIISSLYDAGTVDPKLKGNKMLTTTSGIIDVSNHRGIGQKIKLVLNRFTEQNRFQEAGIRCYYRAGDANRGQVLAITSHYSPQIPFSQPLDDVMNFISVAPELVQLHEQLSNIR